jgi:hypothetical protein
MPVRILARSSPARAVSIAATWAVYVLALYAICAQAGSPERVHRYRVALSEDLETLTVHACFAGEPPAHLVAESLDAALAIEDAHWSGTNKMLQPNGPELQLKSPAQTPCLDYRVALVGAAGRHQRGGNPTRRVGSDLLTDIGLWFWRPQELSDEEDIEVSFSLPNAISVSAPWSAIDNAERPLSFRVGHSPVEWPGTVAFGRFTLHTLKVATSELHVAILDARPRADAQQILSWLDEAAHAVAAVYGRFPVPSLQVVVVPGARGPSPVPSAYVLRGGGPGAHFFINQRKPLAELRSDWTAVHELSHLLLPYIVPEDIWLSEGLASYYQFILLARARLIPGQAAWQSMHRALAKGQQDEPDITLSEATEHMYRNGNFMHVYWEGAAIMLLADQRLREGSGGALSLDVVLDRLQRCCANPDKAWHAEDLMLRMDALTETKVFTELYSHEVKARGFPDLSDTYRRLGLKAVADGELRLDPGAPRSADRDAIMAPFAPNDGDERSHKQ